MHRRTDLPTGLLLLSERQAGLVSVQQAIDHGMSRRSIETASQGLWTPRCHGVLALTGWSPSELSPTAAKLDDARRRAWAVQLVHPSAAASDELAAELCPFDGWWSGDAERHVVPRGAGRRSGWRTRDPQPGDIVVRDGLRQTSPLRTLLDLASWQDADALELAVESAIHRRLVRLADLELAAARLPTLRLVLARRPLGTPPTESMLDTLGLQLCRTVPGLPEPVRQHAVYDAAGMFAGRVDLAWPALGMFLEMLGAFHDDQVDHDLARANAIVAASGWIAVTLRWRQVVATPRTSARMLARTAASASRRSM